MATTTRELRRQLVLARERGWDVLATEAERARGLPTGLLLAVASMACGGPETTPQLRPDTQGQPAAAGNFRGRIYERNFVFTSLSGDSAFLVPWLMTAQARPGASTVAVQLAVSKLVTASMGTLT